MSHNINQLRFDSILPDLKVTGRKQIFHHLSAHVQKLIGSPSDNLANALYDLEKECSSGIGNGVAIPHTKLPRLTNPLVIFTRASNPIDFKAADNMPVDLICLVLSPNHEGASHLQLLAKVSRFFNDKYFCESLRHAQDSDDIKMILNDVNRKRLAA